MRPKCEDIKLNVGKGQIVTVNPGELWDAVKAISDAVPDDFKLDDGTWLGRAYKLCKTIIKDAEKFN